MEGDTFGQVGNDFLKRGWYASCWQPCMLVGNLLCCTVSVVQRYNHLQVGYHHLPFYSVMKEGGVLPSSAFLQLGPRQYKNSTLEKSVAFHATN